LYAPVFNKISDSLKTAVNKIKYFDDEKSLKKALDELKKSLLKADVHHKVTKELINEVSLETKKKRHRERELFKSAAIFPDRYPDDRRLPGIRFCRYPADYCPNDGSAR
jgi:signal recognition particle GTPase